MTTPSSKLSPVRCRQLREEGILRLMVQLLHEHTFVPYDQPEESTNIKSFLEDFNRKSKQRQRLSFEIRTIIENTAEKTYEFEILEFVESLRNYTECLYRFMTNVPESKPQIILPIAAIKTWNKIHLSSGGIEIYGMIEQLGGVHAILDLIRAQRRFFSKFQDEVIYCEVRAPIEDAVTKPEIKVSVIDVFEQLRDTVTSQETAVKQQWSTPKDVREVHYCLLTDSLITLGCFSNFWFGTGYFSSFLLKNRWFYELLIDTLEDAYKDNYSHYHFLVRAVCDNLINIADRGFDCGIIKRFTKISISIDNPKTQIPLLHVIDLKTFRNLEKTLEFCSVEGSIDMLIDILTPSGETNTAVFINQEQLGVYITLINFSLKMLQNITQFLLKSEPISAIEKQIATIYESRDVCAAVAHHLKFPWRYLRTDDHIRYSFEILNDVLERSRDQRRKFMETDDALATVKKFETIEYKRRFKFVEEYVENILKLCRDNRI